MPIDSSYSSFEQALAKVNTAENPNELLQSLCAAACAATGSASGGTGAAVLIYDAAGVRALAAFGKHIPVQEHVDDAGVRRQKTNIPQMPPTWLLALASSFPRILAQTIVDAPLAVGENIVHSIFIPLFIGEKHKVSLAVALPKEAFSKHVLATMKVLRVLAQQADKDLQRELRTTTEHKNLQKQAQTQSQTAQNHGEGQAPINSPTSAASRAHPDSQAASQANAQISVAQGELAQAIHIVSEVQQCQRSFEAAVTFCAITSATLDLSRVALATVHGPTHDSDVRVFAIDQMEKFLRGTRTVRLMEEAMAECLAQDCAVSYNSLGQSHMPFADEHADIPHDDGRKTASSPSIYKDTSPDDLLPDDLAPDDLLPENAPQDNALEENGPDHESCADSQQGTVITAAAATFLRTAGGKSLLCLPLKCRNETHFVALFVAERDLSEREELTLRLASELVVSHFENLAIHEKPLLRRVGRYIKCKLDDWFGPAHTILKVAAVCIAAFFALTLTVQDTLHLSAPLVVEGIHSYTQTSPVDSYLIEVRARPGDAVKKGDLLGRVDNTDIRLEKTAIETQRKIHLSQAYQYSQEGKEAEASLARLEAQKDTVNLQWAEARLQMTSLYAAVDGFVVSEDMYSRLGQPVRRGQELFEVA